MESQKVDDNWGYLHDLGNLQLFFDRFNGKRSKNHSKTWATEASTILRLEASKLWHKLKWWKDVKGAFQGCEHVITCPILTRPELKYATPVTADREKSGFG